ncbi:SAF domain-containing protein [Emergencia sp.]|uniref:SAF domain-containing protein n=1 Tax=Emergencia sp. TaxID=1926557 RepID=UPI003AEFE966
MEKGKKIIGILLILISIAALFTWEKWGKNRFLYDDVLVFTQNIEKGTVITEEMISTIKMDVGEEDRLEDGDKKNIIGREAAFFIHKGAPLFKEYFMEEGLTANQEQDRYILSIPDDWLLSAPKTLSRGDRAYFYFNGKFVTSALVSFAEEERKSFEVVVSSRQAEALSKIASRGDEMIITYTTQSPSPKQ